MKKLAFIDHSFHIKSTATRFLIDILEKHFHTKVFWDNSWDGGEKIDLQQLKLDGFDYLVFFQMMDYDVDLIKGLNFESVTFIPMYDGVHLFQDHEWKPLSEFKFLNFSTTLHEKLSRFGIKSYSYQYYPDPQKFSQVQYNDLRGFFWQRIDHINWFKIEKLIAKTRFDGIHIHGAVDPFHTFDRPDDDAVKRYNINISQWFEKRSDYLETLHQANVFFAPRLYEGIGMSFLEAMAKGMCVVAPNNPTVNEYIEDGVTGLLYDPYNVKPLDFSQAHTIGHQARDYIAEKYKEWEVIQQAIPKSIRETYVPQLSRISVPDKPFSHTVHEILRDVYQRYVPLFVKPVFRFFYHQGKRLVRDKS